MPETAARGKPLRKLNRINLRSEIRKRSNNNHRTSLVSSSTTLTSDTITAAQLLVMMLMMMVSFRSQKKPIRVRTECKMVSFTENVFPI